MKEDEPSKYKLINTSARKTTQDKQSNDKSVVSNLYIKVSRYIRHLPKNKMDLTVTSYDFCTANIVLILYLRKSKNK